MDRETIELYNKKLDLLMGICPKSGCIGLVLGDGFIGGTVGGYVGGYAGVYTSNTISPISKVVGCFLTEEPSKMMYLRSGSGHLVAVRVQHWNRHEPCYVQYIISDGLYICENSINLKLNNVDMCTEEKACSEYLVVKSKGAKWVGKKEVGILSLKYKWKGSAKPENGSILALFGLDGRVGLGVKLPFVVVSVLNRPEWKRVLHNFVEKMGLYCTETRMTADEKTVELLIIQSERLFRKYFRKVEGGFIEQE